MSKITEHYPDHNIVGEENVGNRASSSTYVWIIDPIDGTSNFINRKKDFAISVAFGERNRGVFGIIYDVMAGKLYRAHKGSGAFLNDGKLDAIHTDNRLENELIAINMPWGTMEEMRPCEPLFKLGIQARGVRLYGATTMELNDMAEGLLGGYVQYYVNSWDYAAGRILLEELGCKFTDLEGNDIDMLYSGGIVAAGAGLHEQIIRSLNAAASETRQ
ncbi:inositol monophosphatase [Paenibacillus elgii]|uniref:Inositol monophosphatase n=1 Tax=Paenibacillus elgii TaxID=189691 RepID=A0A2T6G995_9BACL|nr:inositol monophosphatase [Paenibacillus elgii]PUA40710.1 inositol monophosphatase [Paenibacillus elgii]